MFFVVIDNFSAVGSDGVCQLGSETTTASKLIHERWKFLLNERIVGLNLSIAGGIESEKKRKNSCSF